MAETPAETAARLRETTEAMANQCSVDMALWNLHSNTALDAAALIESQAAEIERLQAGGCARDQTTTQYCAEAVAFAAEAAELRAEVERLKDPWRPIEEAPKDGTPIVGAETYRYQPYKPDGVRQKRQPGRWQRLVNEYGRWANEAPPAAWMPTSALPPPAED